MKCKLVLGGGRRDGKLFIALSEWKLKNTNLVWYRTRRLPRQISGRQRLIGLFCSAFLNLEVRAVFFIYCLSAGFKKKFKWVERMKAESSCNRRQKPIANINRTVKINLPLMIFKYRDLNWMITVCAHPTIAVSVSLLPPNLQYEQTHTNYSQRMCRQNC